MGIYTVAFRECNFTTQLRLPEVEAFEQVARQSKWFADLVVPQLGGGDSNNAAISFQCFPLDGLLNTWAGHFGSGGKYLSFTVVQVAND